MLWQLRDRVLVCGERPLIMGIVNVTPDSFSDGGRLTGVDAAAAYCEQLVQEGADLLDIGGESTRPGASPVPLEEEWARVAPLLNALRDRITVPLSIDTYKPEIARRACAEGASIINDVSGGRWQAGMAEVVVATGAGYVLMHSRGRPECMQLQPQYEQVVNEVKAELASTLQELVRCGVARERVVIDPGIGFGKTVEHNLALLARLDELRELQRPILIGVSRKSFLGKIGGGSSTEKREAGSIAAQVWATARGGAAIWRVHDVASTRAAANVVEQLRRAGVEGSAL